MDKAETNNDAPDFTLISAFDPETTADLLRRNQWLHNGEQLTTLERAGQGNMNCTLRTFIRDAHGNQRTLIIKQSRPWVEKYPMIEAPVERSLIEARFYQRIQSHPEVAAAMPMLIGQDTTNFAFCLQDLVGASDMTDAYQTGELPLAAAAKWLSLLHSIELNETDQAQFQNHALRSLNHLHVFVIPFEKQLPIDLDQITRGLESLRCDLIKNDCLIQTAKEMGDQYIDLVSGDQDRACLLHGDYYPGSFMRRNAERECDDQSFFVIDPEFCFLGPREYDLGVLLAHAVFCGHDPHDAAHEILFNYADRDAISHQPWKRFAGLEILRRLFGVAQLPLAASLDRKRFWSSVAQSWLS